MSGASVAEDLRPDGPGRPDSGSAASGPLAGERGRGTATASDHARHRDRLRAKFDAVGGDPFLDYELLEMLLFRSLPRCDTKSLAKALLREFGSLADILAADRERLRRIKGIGPSVATDLKVIEAVMQRVSLKSIPRRQALTSWNAVLDYLQKRQGKASVEQFRVLFLDKRNGLIGDEEQQSGTVDHTPAYPREIARRALELGATAMILVHNHPSGDTTPSGADIAMTREIVAVLKPLGISVHDHVIIGRHGHTSLKSLGLM